MVRKINPESRNNSLILAYIVAKAYNSLPKSIDEQKRLISIYYTTIMGIPLDKIRQEQIRSVAKRILNHAYKEISLLSSLQETAVCTLVGFKRALELGNYREAESLEETLCIQLEREDDKSKIVQEYLSLHH